MKIRLSIWLMMAAATAVMVLAIWQHHSHSTLTGQPLVQTSHQESMSPVVVVKQAPTTPVKTAPIRIAAPAQISASIQMIVSGSASFQAREGAIKKLAGRLPDDDLKSLYDFLRQPGLADGQQPSQVLKNELMDALCELQPPPQGLRDLLTQIYQNTSQDLVLRDYAVQHLAAFYRQMSSAVGMDGQMQANELQQTRQTLLDALNQTDSSIAGTALLGLSQLAQAHWPGLNPDQISDAALKLAGDASVGELSKITAFQVCASLNTKDAVPLVQYAAEKGQTVPVQISAIAALGALGDASQIPLLNSLIQGDNDRLRLPAQHALSQINGRLKHS
jgi:hypothetical protein